MGCGDTGFGGAKEARILEESFAWTSEASEPLEQEKEMVALYLGLAQAVCLQKRLVKPLSNPRSDDFPATPQSAGA